MRRSPAHRTLLFCVESDETKDLLPRKYAQSLLRNPFKYPYWKHLLPCSKFFTPTLGGMVSPIAVSVPLRLTGSTSKTRFVMSHNLACKCMHNKEAED